LKVAVSTVASGGGLHGALRSGGAPLTRPPVRLFGHVQLGPYEQDVLGGQAPAIVAPAIAELANHEAAQIQPLRHRAEQRRAGSVAGPRPEFDDERRNRLEQAFSALQGAQLGALSIQLDEVRRRKAALDPELVQRDRRHVDCVRKVLART